MLELHTGSSRYVTVAYEKLLPPSLISQGLILPHPIPPCPHVLVQTLISTTFRHSILFSPKELNCEPFHWPFDAGMLSLSQNRTEHLLSDVDSEALYYDSFESFKNGL